MIDIYKYVKYINDMHFYINHVSRNHCVVGNPHNLGFHIVIILGTRDFMEIRRPTWSLRCVTFRAEGPHNLSKSVRVSHDPFISVPKGKVNHRARSLDIIGRTGITDEQDTDVDVRVFRCMFGWYPRSRGKCELIGRNQLWRHRWNKISVCGTLSVTSWNWTHFHVTICNYLVNWNLQYFAHIHASQISEFIIHVCRCPLESTMKLLMKLSWLI